MCKHFLRVMAVLLLVILGGGQLSGCAEIRKSLSYEKTVPDAFLLMSRVPLEVPETVDLIAIATVAARRRQLELFPEKPLSHLSQVLTGYPQPGWSSDRARTPALQTFLQMAGADSGWSDIRAIVDHEAITMLLERRHLIDRMMFWRESLPEGGPAVDMGKELRRLQEGVR